MLNKILAVAAIAFLCPTLAFADDIFLAFGSGADADRASTTTADVGTGSVFIYSDGQFTFNAAALIISNNDPSVIEFTGGEAFNPQLVSNGFPIGLRFNNPESPNTPLNFDEVDPATLGDLTLVAVLGAFGVGPGTQLLDPLFDQEVGVNGAFPLARVDYNIVGIGSVDLELSLGENGVAFVDSSTDPIINNVLSPELGSASLTVGPSVIPEPSSLALLMLGSVVLITRRKRV